MRTLSPIDDIGRDLCIGDWVRLVRLPDLSDMPVDVVEVFRRALGLTFRIDEFDRHGLAHLDLSRKVARLESIFVEPYLLHRTRKGPAHRSA